MSLATPLRFEKWEGLGNDFVLVEDDPAGWSSERVRRVCDRRFGVGADGVLFIQGAASGEPRMIVRNADGSRPEMCGNGLRCVAGYLAARAPEAGGDRVVATDAGGRRCVTELGPRGAFEVTIDMGAARIEAPLLVAFEGQTLEWTVVDVGNPHAISFAPHEDALLDRVGPLVATLPEGGINVELCRVVGASPPQIEVIVWERGVGRTLACGTGACAVAAAACVSGRAPFDTPVQIDLPGGALSIVVPRALDAISMTGPARRVFRGELEAT